MRGLRERACSGLKRARNKKWDQRISDEGALTWGYKAPICHNVLTMMVDDGDEHESELHQDAIWRLRVSAKSWNERVDDDSESSQAAIS